MKHYSDHDDNMDIETVEIDGSNVTVITIYEPLFTQWYEEGLERVVIHVEDDTNTKFL